MKDIDEELNSQIKSVFDDFDDGRSELGWASLREKYPEKVDRKIPLWWISGIAASLLLVCGVWLFLSGPVGNEKDFLNNAKEARHPDLEGKSHNETTVIAKKKTTDGGKINVQELAPSPVQKNTIAPVGMLQQQLKNDMVAIVNQPKESNAITHHTHTIDQPVVVATPIEQIVKLAKDTNSVQINQTAGTAKNEAVNEVAPHQLNKTTAEFLAEQSKLNVAKAEVKDKEKRSATQNSFEVFTGTFLNYFPGSDVKVNAGFGLNANIQVSKDLFLTVGAGVSQNKMAYDSRQTSTLPEARSSDLMQNSPNSVAYTSEPFVTDIKLAAQLLAIDIPIAIKFYPTKKQNFYISTGINSNSYLNQQYIYSYTVLNPSSFYKIESEPEEQVEKSKFKGFDFANSALFAIGINQQIGNNTMVFEPYFKPAIGNMGDKNLRINTVGLNLRFNFSNGKKK